MLTDLEPIDLDETVDLPPRLPALETLLARAERAEAPTDWRRFVLLQLGLASPGAELPVGATLAAAAGLHASEGTWLLATPLHLLATLSDVRMHAAGPLELDAAEAATLAARLTAGCGDADFTLHAVGRVLLAHFRAALDVVTHDPAPHAGRRLDVQLPGGPDGGLLRRRMTELQMVLHDVMGATAPGVSVNALWLWGGGRAGVTGRAAWPVVASDDLFLDALHRLDHGRVDRAGARLETWRLGALEGCDDVFAAADRAWFARLAADLASGRVPRATLHFAGRAYALRPSQRWRFWVKPRPWWELAA